MTASNFFVLILGDGDFSFSLSMLKQLQITVQQPKFDLLGCETLLYELFTSSFDSEEEIRKKYPESNHILNELRKDKNATVNHDVDATKLEHCQVLQDRLVSRGEIKNCFTDIIFNFPHLGKEDCIAHSSLLAHVMHR